MHIHSYMSVTNSTENAKTAWLSPDEFADLMPGEPKTATVRKWCRQGKLPGAIQMPGGRWQIPQSAVAVILGAAA